MTEQAQIYPNLRQGFETYWNETLFPALKSKEKLRKKYVSRFWLLVLLALFILPVVTIGIYVFNNYFGKDIDSGLIFIVIALFAFLLRQPFKSYKKKMKNDVMQTFVGYFKDFSYHQGDGLSLSEINESRIFPYFETAKADDCFSGPFEGVHMRLCEQILTKIVRSGKKSREVTVFQGIAIELDMQKKFQGHTIVLKDHGLFSRFTKPQGMERVILEDPFFEKTFEVYSTDQIEARYLLTPVFMERIIKPTLSGMAEDGHPYRGFLYAGLMIDENGDPRVVEFNCRFGDPETQPIMMRMRSDLVDLCYKACTDGGLLHEKADYDERKSVGVVLAAHNYPSAPRIGDVITGLDTKTSEDIKIFHAGTADKGDTIVTKGGRVLCVTALGESVSEARNKAYRAIENIHFDGMFYRKDIAYRAIKREEQQKTK